MPTLRAAALALALAALLPASASAGTVTAGATLTFTADPGEANDVSVVRAGALLAVSDAQPIDAPGCQGDDTPSVSCPAADAVVVALGDGDDRLVAGALGGGTRVEASGDAGADRLDATAAAGYVALAGGAGDDTLLAGTGETDVTGGDGNDTMTGGPEGAFTTFLMGTAADGADTLAGGAGFDVAGYGERSAAVRLTADGVPDDGAAGEGDAIAPTVERLEGGAAADVLGGSPAVAAELSGGAGSDFLGGGAHADLLSGGDGDDTLAGGPGDDLAAPSPPIAEPGDEGPAPGAGESGADGGADAFAGGEGFDTLSYETRTAPVAASLDGAANDGEAGERDNAGVDVEAVTGGRGADLLTGSARPERLLGGAGGDTIDAGGGLDEVRAGDGNDSVRAQDGVAEWVTCGAGNDTMSGDYHDVPVACEALTLTATPPGVDTRRPRVRIAGLPPRPRYRHVRRGLRPRLTADEPVSYVVELLGAATRAHISAVRPFNLTLVRRTIRLTSSPRRISLRPKRALLGPRRKLRVRIRVTATDAAGNVRVVRTTIKARR